MTIRDLLLERYAPLRGLKDRSVVIFGQTIDRLEQFLGRVAVLEDFTDLQMAKYLRWRADAVWQAFASTGHRGQGQGSFGRSGQPGGPQAAHP